MRAPVPLAQAYRLVNHGPVTLISAAAHGKVNVMAASWVMPLDYEPPKLAAVIAEGTATRELVEASRGFVVSLPTIAMLQLVHDVGHTSGHRIDKLARFAIPTAPASRVDAPLVEGCVGWLECELLPEQPTVMTHDLFLAAVVAAWADDEVFVEGRWRFGAHPERRTLHHLGGGELAVTGESHSASRS